MSISEEANRKPVATPFDPTGSRIEYDHDLRTMPVTIENPILNSPFDVPIRHFRFDEVLKVFEVG